MTKGGVSEIMLSIDPPDGRTQVPEGLEVHLDGNGARHNNGKSRMDLICPIFLEGLGDVLRHGADKYDERNWERGNNYSVPIASLLRHLMAFQRGEDLDPESGLPHVDHMAFNVMQLKRLTVVYQQGDDRSPVLRAEGT